MPTATIATGDPGRRSITLTLPPGDLGTDCTCMAMRAVAEDAAERSQRVTDLTRTLSRGFLPKSLYDWLRAHLKFSRDSRGLEHVRHPDEILARIEREQIAAVDCDDLATLAAAVIIRGGLRPCFVVVSRSSTGDFQHVFYGTWVPTAQQALPWKLADNVSPPGFIPFDPQERTPAGRMPEGVRRFRIYPL